MKAWYAVQVRVGREAEAAEGLVRQGMKVWLPCIEREVRHARSVKQKRQSLFPGYVFLHLSEQECCWTSIRSTRGVIGAVHFGLFYPVVPQELIEALMENHDESAIPDVDAIRQGQVVRVCEGAMQGLRGRVLFVSGQERVIVLLNMLSQQVKTTVPTHLLEKA